MRKKEIEKTNPIQIFGYKGFNLVDGKLMCRDMVFEIGKVAEIKGKLVMCDNGIHYCRELNNVHSFYNLGQSVIGIVEILGEIINDSDFKKSCTNKLKIVKLLTKEEVLRLSNTGNDNVGFINSGDSNTGHSNTGHGNTGHWNTGDRNTGHSNTGHSNTGHSNTGHWNTGHSNTGHWNTGDSNTGHSNTGHRNTGHSNTGHWNTGCWNTGNYSTGFFNTKEHNAYIFDNPAEMKTSEFLESKFMDALTSAPFYLTEWVWYSEEEKRNDKAKEYTEGYTKSYSFKEACEKWWSNMSEKNKKIIMSIPNFEAAKFEEITGIKI